MTFPITATLGATPIEVKAAAYMPESVGMSDYNERVGFHGNAGATAGSAVIPASAMSGLAAAAAFGLISTLPVKAPSDPAAGNRLDASGHPAYGLVHHDANGTVPCFRGRSRFRAVTT